MNPVIKEIDPVHSNTTISYEAVPAVGADGTNIMKLIPVQTVNRQFFQSPTSQPERDPTPQRAEAMSISSEPLQMFKTNVELTNSVNKYLSQQQNTKLRTIAPSATPAANIGMSGRVPSQLPVTVKSLELPRGQCPRTPSNTQVQTVPAPELPKKQIFTSSANSSPSTGLFNGLTLSCCNQEFDQKMDSAFDTLQFLCKVAVPLHRCVQQPEGEASAWDCCVSASHPRMDISTLHMFD